MVKQLPFALSIHSRSTHGAPQGALTSRGWTPPCMHDMGSLGHTLQMQTDLARGRENLALYRDVWRGVASCLL